MHKNALAAVVFLSILLFSCNKGSNQNVANEISSAVVSTNQETINQQNQINMDKAQFDEIAKIVIKKRISDIPEEYYYFFGRTIDEILDGFGENYKTNIAENTNSTSKESAWYTKTTYYEYEDASITVYKTNAGIDWVEAIYTNRIDFQYVGNIKIGGPYQSVIDQLGNPNQLSAYNKPELIYSANNYILYFEISNGNVKSISIVVQL